MSDTKRPYGILCAILFGGLVCLALGSAVLSSAFAYRSDHDDQWAILVFIGVLISLMGLGAFIAAWFIGRPKKPAERPAAAAAIAQERPLPPGEADERRRSAYRMIGTVLLLACLGISALAVRYPEQSVCRGAGLFAAVGCLLFGSVILFSVWLENRYRNAAPSHKGPEPVVDRGMRAAVSGNPDAPGAAGNIPYVDSRGRLVLDTGRSDAGKGFLWNMVLITASIAAAGAALIFIGDGLAVRSEGASTVLVFFGKAIAWLSGPFCILGLFLHFIWKGKWGHRIEIDRHSDRITARTSWYFFHWGTNYRLAEFEHIRIERIKMTFFDPNSSGSTSNTYDYITEDHFRVQLSPRSGSGIAGTLSRFAPLFSKLSGVPRTFIIRDIEALSDAKALAQLLSEHTGLPVTQNV